MEAIAFATTVTDRDWDKEVGGWRCQALRIPGAQIDDVFVGGKRIDKAWYEVAPHLGLIRWARENRPDIATVVIKLTHELDRRELTLYWKKLAIVLPVIASIVVALITFAGTLYGTHKSSGETTSTVAPTSTSVSSSSSTTTSGPPPSPQHVIQTASATTQSVSQDDGTGRCVRFGVLKKDGTWNNPFFRIDGAKQAALPKRNDLIIALRDVNVRRGFPRVEDGKRLLGDKVDTIPEGDSARVIDVRILYDDEYWVRIEQ